MSINNGDLYQLGDHYLICGDATDPIVMSRLIGDKKVDMLLTDPPYGVAYVESKQGFITENESHQPILNDQTQSSETYQEFSCKWLGIIKPYLNQRNSLYIFNSDKMLFALHQAIIESDMKFSQLLIWIKNHAIVGRLDYLPQHELIAYGWLGRHTFHHSKGKSVIFHPKPNKSKLHPTMKPVGLLRKLILNSSSINNIVLDPFGGSGSTLIACQQTKRICLMTEKDAVYVQTIIDRWQSFTHKEAKKL